MSKEGNPRIHPAGRRWGLRPTLAGIFLQDAGPSEAALERRLIADTAERVEELLARLGRYPTTEEALVGQSYGRVRLYELCAGAVQRGLLDLIPLDQSHAQTFMALACWWRRERQMPLLGQLRRARGLAANTVRGHLLILAEREWLVPLRPETPGELGWDWPLFLRRGVMEWDY